MKVFWSVGHDARKKGAYNVKYKLYEYDLCVDLTQYCVEEAMELGLDCEKVYSDRLGNAIKEVNMRCEKNDIAVEVHINAMKDANHIRGCEVEYCVGSVRGEKLAKHVQDVMLKDLDQRDCTNDARANLGFLKKTKCTAIIPEPFFLSNEEDIQKFILDDKEAGLRKIAKALALGVYNFVKEEIKEEIKEVKAVEEVKEEVVEDVVEEDNQKEAKEDEADA